MKRKTQPVKITKDDRGGEDHEHPAFGTISFSRISGHSGKLYGSALENHDHFIEMVVRRSSQKHDHGHSWYFGDRELVSVHLSPAQFVDLMTNMNVGSGVPCTLDHVGGEQMPSIAEEHETEHNRIRSKFKEDISGSVAALTDREDRAKAILAKKVLNKADREEIVDLFFEFSRIFRDTAPFLVKQFQESAEKVVVSAKAEVEAWMQHTIHTAGMEAIADGRFKQLPTKKEEIPLAQLEGVRYDGKEETKPCGKCNTLPCQCCAAPEGKCVNSGACNANDGCMYKYLKTFPNGTDNK